MFYLFLYGSLTHPHTLSNILHTTARPELLPANMKGFKARLWGEYLTLVLGNPSDIVHEMAYGIIGIHSHSEISQLATYETEQYRLEDCMIEFLDGRIVYGKTFVWAGEVVELREGVWDLKDWALGRLD